MTSHILGYAVVVGVLACGGCSQPQADSAVPSFAFASPVSPSLVDGSVGTHETLSRTLSGGGTVKETLSGPAINGVTPEGEALADQSRFASGGSTILTVRVKNINLPDGTVLPVSLDFTPIGSMTLSRGEGIMRADLGHFAVSNDEVRVHHEGSVILIGPFFR